MEEGESEEEFTEGCAHSREAEKEGVAWGLYKGGKGLASENPSVSGSVYGFISIAYNCSLRYGAGS